MITQYTGGLVPLANLFQTGAQIAIYDLGVAGGFPPPPITPTFNVAVLGRISIEISLSLS